MTLFSPPPAPCTGSALRHSPVWTISCWPKTSSKRSADKPTVHLRTPSKGSLPCLRNNAVIAWEKYRLTQEVSLSYQRERAGFGRDNRETDHDPRNFFAPRK